MTKKTTIHLPVETELTITPDAFASGLVFSQVNPGDSAIFVSAVTASTPIVLGPFNDALTYLVELDTGAVTHVKDFAGAPTSGGVTASSTDTFTNKTIDANGTGNSISNIDVADLANGTDGELITWDATGAPAVVATGTATHVLTSNGVGTAPTFQAAAGGGGSLVHISTATLSATSTVDFVDGTGGVVLDGTYDRYIFTFNNIISSASSTLLIRMSTDTGSTFPSASGDYKWVEQSVNTSSAVSAGTDGSTTATEIRPLGASFLTSHEMNGTIQLFSPAASTRTVIDTVFTDYHTSGNSYRYTGTGYYATAAVTDAIRFTVSTGSMTSGTIKLYGISDS